VVRSATVVYLASSTKVTQFCWVFAVGGVGKTTETQSVFFTKRGTFVDVESFKGAAVFNFVIL